MNQLHRKTLLGFGLVLAGLGILLFVPAWTFDFWQAWVYLVTYAVSNGLIIVYLWHNEPQLLERRLRAGPGAEKEKTQKRIMLLASLAFIGMYLLASLDHRFSWSKVPFPVVLAGDVLVVLGFLITFLVFKENPFGAATITVAAGQKVISTGPYGLVRHPMYSGGLVMFFGTPLALGSWWGLLMFIPATLIIIWRLLEEEKFLLKNLPGYAEYYQQVRFRLVPFVF